MSNEDARLGSKKYFELLGTLNKSDSDCMIRATLISTEPDLSEENAKFLFDNAAKMKRIINSLISTHISSLEIPVYDKNILHGLLKKFSMISDIKGMMMVADQIAITSMEARIDNV